MKKWASFNREALPGICSPRDQRRFGYTARFIAASDMLHDLSAQDSYTQLSRRLRRYTTPTALCIDEVGYLAYDARYADLLFEVITRRYQLHRPVMLTTNKSFGG